MSYEIVEIGGRRSINVIGGRCVGTKPNPITINTSPLKTLLNERIVHAVDLRKRVSVEVKAWPGVMIGNGPTMTTVLSVIEHSPAGSEFFLDSHGTSYIRSRDYGNLRPSPDIFYTDEAVQIYLNGTKQVKGVEVLWTSLYSFLLTLATENGDILEIIS
jgi:hypothetical protein